MEKILQLRIKSEKVTSGEDIKGEVLIFPDKNLDFCKLEIIFTGKELVFTRDIEENTLKCEESVTKKEFHRESFTKGFESPIINGTPIYFEFSTVKSFPSTFNLVHFSDVFRISYKIKAILFNKQGKQIKNSVPIIINAQYPELKSSSFSLNLRKCCLRLGSLDFVANLNKSNLTVHEKLLLSLAITNEKSKGKITNIILEVWKNVKIRDKNNQFKPIKELLYRKNEETNITTGESLLSSEQINFEVDFGSFSGRIHQSFSTSGEFIVCEYSLKLFFTVDSCCGSLEKSINIPIAISH